jgi:hypothetical protein
MLKPIGNHAQGKRLDFGLSLRRGGTVSQNARKLGHLRYPAPVILTLKLNLEPQANLRSRLYRGPRLGFVDMSGEHPDQLLGPRRLAIADLASCIWLLCGSPIAHQRALCSPTHAILER